MILENMQYISEDQADNYFKKRRNNFKSTTIANFMVRDLSHAHITTTKKLIYSTVPVEMLFQREIISNLLLSLQKNNCKECLN